MSENRNEHHHYIKKIRNVAVLSLEEEYKLAKDWRDNQDRKAMEKLAEAHLKLVAKVASGYRGYGLPMSDLIAEGNIGMMQAMKHYEPDRGFRFSTYAVWWIKASMQEYILHTWSLVKIGTTAAQKKLFFSLKKTKKAFIDEAQEQDGEMHSDHLSPDLVQKIATKLKVSEEEVRSMHQRIGSKDSSLNTPVKESESTAEWMDWIADESDNQEIQVVQRDEMQKRQSAFNYAMQTLNAREREIIIGRRLDEPPKTLEEMSHHLDISRERVRQLEISAFEKLKKVLKSSPLRASMN